MKLSSAKFLASVTLVATMASNADDQLQHLLSELKPTLVAPNIVSTDQFEYGSSLSPDGQQFAFVKALAKFQKSALVLSKLTNGKWSEPELMPFSGMWHDTNPYFSKDDNTFYFTSRRPVKGGDKPRSRMWQTKQTDDGFDEPQLVSGEINGKHSVIYPTVHSNKDIFFCSVIKGDNQGGLDLYLSRYEQGTYSKPVAITELNTAQNDADPELSTDGKLLFYTSMRAGGLGHFDLHVSVKQKDGKWGEPINLGKNINSSAMDSDPILSADGNTLFFSSDKVANIAPASNYSEIVQRQNNIENGLMNIYQVDISELSAYLKALG